MKSKKTSSRPRLYEYRIKYNAEERHVHIDNYHYYIAETAIQALDYHNSMIERKKIKMQTLSIEKYNPFSLAWEDESQIIHQEVPPNNTQDFD